MSNKKLSSDDNNEMRQLARRFEEAEVQGQTLYLDADKYADLADWYATQNNYGKAFEAIECGISIHPGNNELFTEQAYLYLDNKNTEKAGDVIRKHLTNDNSAEVKILKATYCFQTKDYQEAENLIESIEDKDDLPNIIDATYLYLDMDMPEKAAVWIERGRGQYDDNTSFLSLVADYDIYQKRYTEAIDLLNRLLDQDPYSPSYWYNLGRCHFELGEYDKAIEACDYALVSDEEYADAILMKGHAFLQLENGDEAIACYKSVQKLQTVEDRYTDTFIGLAYVAKEDWNNALIYLQTALSENAGDTQASSIIYANAALCLHKQGRIAEAHMYLDKAIALTPDLVDCYTIGGRICLGENNPSKAINYFKKALQLSPYADTWFEIGNYLLEAGELQEVAFIYENIKKLEPDFDRIDERLALIYLLLEDWPNFETHNRLCRNPISEEEQQYITDFMARTDGQGLPALIKDIINKLK